MAGGRFLIFAESGFGFVELPFDLVVGDLGLFHLFVEPNRRRFLAILAGGGEPAFVSEIEALLEIDVRPGDEAGEDGFERFFEGGIELFLIGEAEIVLVQPKHLEDAALGIFRRR